MKITSLDKAINNTIEKLQDPDYRNFKEVVKISEKLMAQAYYFKLEEYDQDEKTIALGTGLSEKTIRFMRDAKQATILSILKLKDYLQRVRKTKPSR